MTIRRSFVLALLCAARASAFAPLLSTNRRETRTRDVVLSTTWVRIESNHGSLGQAFLFRKRSSSGDEERRSKPQRNPEFQQRPGESDIKFIKRITSLSQDALDRSQSNGEDETKSNSTIPGEEKSKYRPIEEWHEQHQQSMTWEERVQFEGQRFGNQVKQDGILRQHLKGF